jgi:hypothetical protein
MFMLYYVLCTCHMAPMWDGLLICVVCSPHPELLRVWLAVALSRHTFCTLMFCTNILFRVPLASSVHLFSHHLGSVNCLLDRCIDRVLLVVRAYTAHWFVIRQPFWWFVSLLPCSFSARSTARAHVITRVCAYKRVLLHVPFSVVDIGW